MSGQRAAARAGWFYSLIRAFGWLSGTVKAAKREFRSGQRAAGPTKPRRTSRTTRTTRTGGGSGGGWSADGMPVDNWTSPGAAETWAAPEPDAGAPASTGRYDDSMTNDVQPDREWADDSMTNDATDASDPSSAAGGAV